MLTLWHVLSEGEYWKHLMQCIALQRLVSGTNSKVSFSVSSLSLFSIIALYVHSSMVVDPQGWKGGGRQEIRGSRVCMCRDRGGLRMHSNT